MARFTNRLVADAATTASSREMSVIRLSFDPLLSALLELASAGPEPVLVATGYCCWEHWTAHFFQELLVLRVGAEGSPEEPVVQQHKIQGVSACCTSLAPASASESTCPSRPPRVRRFSPSFSPPEPKSRGLKNLRLCRAGRSGRRVAREAPRTLARL